MKNENFLFGCGAFDVLCYVNATEESEKEKYGKRTKEWLALFNYGTLPFYWGTYEPTDMTMFTGMRKMIMKRKSTFMKSVSMRTAIVKRMAFFCLR